MPIMRPSRLTSAPPELPGLIAASVWMKKLESLTPPAERVADRQHHVTDLDRIGIAQLDERELLALGVDAQQGEVVALVLGHQLGVELAPVVQHDADLVGALHD